MSTSHVTLKLDAGAVRLLFADPEARLDLQRVVVAEICKQLWPNYVKEDVQKQITAVLEAAKPELLQLARDEKQIATLVSQRVQSARDNLRGQVKLDQPSPELLRDVDARIRSLIQAQVDERVGKLPTIVDVKANEVFERIERNMDRWINEAVEARIKTEVNARIQRMRDAL